MIIVVIVVRLQVGPKKWQVSVTFGGPCVTPSHFPNGINCVAGYISDFSVSKNIRGLVQAISLPNILSGFPLAIL
jgi:hypothetical protein